MASKKVEIILGAVDKTAPAFRSLTSRIKQVTSSQEGMALAGVAAAGAISAAVVQAAKAYARMVDEMAAVGDSFDKMSQRTGESVEALSSWDYVAQRAGSSIEAVEKGIRKLSVSMYDAQRGSAEYRDAFARLGVQITDGSGQMRSADLVLREMADALNRVSSDTERSALAQRLLGRSGAELLPLLQQGTAAINEQIEHIQRLGGVMSGDFASASAEYEDRMLDLKKAWDGFKMAITEPVLEPVSDGLEDMARLVAVLGGTYSDAADQAERLTIAQRQQQTFDQWQDSFDPQQFMGGDMFKDLGPSEADVAAAKARIQELRDELAKGATTKDQSENFAWLHGQMVVANTPVDPMAGFEEWSDSDWADQLDKDLAGLDDSLVKVGDRGDMVAQQLEASFAQAFAQILQGGGDVDSIFRSLLSGAISIGVRSLFGFKDGGTIPAAANGMMVPDGPRGLDSRLIRAMPGEMVIDRSTTMALQRFLAGADSVVIPQAGGGGATVIKQYVQMPTKPSDVNKLGRDTIEAQRRAERGYL